MDARAILQVTGAIYDAPLVGDWHSSLDLLERAVDCTRVVLMTEDMATGRQSPVASRDPEVEAKYVEHYMPLNEAWLPLSRQDVGKAVLDRQTLNMLRYERSVFFNEFARPHGMVAASGVVIGRERGVVSALILNHAERTAERETLDLEMLSLVQPHYQRAALLWGGRLALTQGDLSLWEAVDKFSTGVIIIDHLGTVLRTNAMASALLRLRSRDVLDHRPFAGPDVLRSDILLALRRSLASSSVQPTVGCHRLHAGNHVYGLTLLPLQGPPDWIGTRRSCYVVVVSDLTRAPVNARDVLEASFGLTKAEAGLAVRVGGEGNLGTIAHDLGIQLSTAKTLLGRALAKTGVHSQSQLVRLVERLSLIEPN